MHTPHVVGVDVRAESIRRVVGYLERLCLVSKAHDAEHRPEDLFTGDLRRGVDIGEKNFLHGFTASLALFVKK